MALRSVPKTSDGRPRRSLGSPLSLWALIVCKDALTHLTDKTCSAIAALPIALADRRVQWAKAKRPFSWEKRAGKVTWQEAVHKEEFRLKAVVENQVVRGRLTVFLGAILLAEISISIRALSRTEAARRGAPSETASGRPFRKIFASYSEEDQDIVEQFENYVGAIGDQYLTTCRDLRSARVWSAPLEQAIGEADVFQLFWSSKSMYSRWVRQEWEYALSLGRQDFVRPVYWEEPCPRDMQKGLPPENLARVSFRCIALGDFGPRSPHGPRPPIPAATSPADDVRRLLNQTFRAKTPLQVEVLPQRALQSSVVYSKDVKRQVRGAIERIDAEIAKLRSSMQYEGIPDKENDQAKALEKLLGIRDQLGRLEAGLSRDADQDWDALLDRAVDFVGSKRSAKETVTKVITVLWRVHRLAMPPPEEVSR